MPSHFTICTLFLKENQFKNRSSVSFKKGDLASEDEEEEEGDEEEDDEGAENEDDQNDTLQAADNNNESTHTKSLPEKRRASLHKARFSRRKRKRRKSQLKNAADKMNSSIADPDQSQNNNGVVDLFGSQKYVQVKYANKLLKLNAFEPIECMYDLRETKDKGNGVQHTKKVNFSFEC